MAHGAASADESTAVAARSSSAAPAASPPAYHLPALPSHRLQPRHRPQHGAQLTARPRPPKLPECGQHRYSRVVSTLKAAVRARSGGRTHALTSPFECAMKNPQWRFARPKVDRRQRTCPSDVTGRRSTRAPRPAGTSLSCAAVAAAGLLDAIFERQKPPSFGQSEAKVCCTFMNHI